MAEVEYTCAGGLAGTVRPAGLMPRNERAFAFNYEAAGTIADARGRAPAIRDDDGGSPGDTLAEYAYLGLERIVTEDYVQPQVKLNYDSGTLGDYAGFDRFERVVDHRWYASGASADRDRYTYGYDRASNRLYRKNTLATGRDELYGYDGIDRLIAFQRGDLNANKNGITGTPAREEDWSLDMTGNWPGFVQKTSGSTDLDQGRTHNPVNEITAITAATGTNWADPVHDRNGNMTTIPKPASLANGLTATYDAWNRLVEVKDGQTVIGRYEYNGLNRRITTHIDSGAPSNPSGIDTYIHYYYNSSWQILETRQSDTQSAQPETLQPRHQYVWSQRYIDAAVLRDENTGTNGLCDDQRLYYLNDANFNVTALLDTAGAPVERYLYSPYGVVTIYDATWTNTRSASSHANVTLSTGRELDPETGLYYYRNRYYSAELGRFVSRDPMGYEGVGFNNIYIYVGNRPAGLIDPLGLAAARYWGWSFGGTAYKAVGGGLKIEYKTKYYDCCIDGRRGTKIVRDLRVHGEIGVGAGMDVRLGPFQASLQFTVATVNVDVGGKCETPCALPGDDAKIMCCRYCTDVGANLPVLPVRTVNIGFGPAFNWTVSGSLSFRICYSFPGCQRPGLAIDICTSFVLSVSMSKLFWETGVQKSFSDCIPLMGEAEMLDW